MKKYVVHFRTYTKSGNIARHNEFVIIHSNTNTPFWGLLQRYIDERLKDLGEECLIISDKDITTDSLYEKKLKGLSKYNFFKQALTVKFADPKKPGELVIEPETI